MAFNRNFKQSPDQSGVGFDNMIAQSAMLEATRLFTELRIRAGNETTAEERRAASQLRSAMVDEICQLARQSKGKKFTAEEIDEMNTMKLWQLRSELGHWYAEAGIRMVKEPAKINQFSVMWPYWIAVRANREHYIKSGSATNQNYKIIILRETEATAEEKKNAAETIEVKKQDTSLDANLIKDMELLEHVEDKIEKEADGEVVDDEEDKQ